jgi:hypothetical protein
MLREKRSEGKVYIQHDQVYTTVGHRAANAWPGHFDMEMSGSDVVLQRHTYRQIRMLGDERLWRPVWMKFTEWTGCMHAGPQVG